MSRSQGGCAVFVMAADGSDVVDLTPRPDGVPGNEWCNYFPSWSPNARQIYFGGYRPATGNDGELFVMEADGSGLTRLTYQPGVDSAPIAR